MLGTIASVALVATAGSAYRNVRQWDAYHHNRITRARLVNGIFLTLVLGLGGVALLCLFIGA